MEDNGGSDVDDRPDNQIGTSAGAPPRNSDASSSDEQQRRSTRARSDRLTYSAQVTVEPQRYHGRGNVSSLQRPHTTHQNRNAPRHGPNNILPSSGHTPNYQNTTRNDPGYDNQFLISQNSIPAYGHHQLAQYVIYDAGYGYQFPMRPVLRPDYQFYNNPYYYQWPTPVNLPVQQNVGPYYDLQDYFEGPNVPGPRLATYIYPTASSDGTSHFFPYHPSLGVSQPPTPEMTLEEMIVKQIEYYFSDENLQKDVYLLSLMDNQGWVLISIIAGFNRIKQMNVEIPFIQDALQASETIEVKGDMLRRRDEWFKWVPKSPISESASPHGNSVNYHKGESSNDFSSTFLVDEELKLEQKTAGSDHQSTAGRVDDEDEDEDEEINDQAAIVPQNSQMGDSEVKDETSGNIAQGSAKINSRSLDHSTGKSSSGGPGNPIKGRLFCGAVSESPPSHAVGFFFGSLAPDSYGLRHIKLSASPQSNLSGSSPPVGSVPKSFSPSQHPSHTLPEEKGYEPQLYNKYIKRCFSDRKKKGIGCSEEMNKLYRFWSFFLRYKFVPSMYNDFRKMALKDAAASHNYGIEYLFQFYCYSLEKEFRDDLYDDFEQLTLQFYKEGNLYGLEVYWAFHHFRGEHEESELVPVKKNPELERLLREEYRSLDDFKDAKAKNATVKEDKH